MTNFQEDEMLISLINGDVAQLEERHNGIVEVVSSRLIVSKFSIGDRFIGFLSIGFMGID